MVWWNDSEKTLCLVEYEIMISRAEEADYTATLITLEVGSWGIPYPEGFLQLAQELVLTRKELYKTC